MNRPILVCVLLLMATASIGAQEASQSNPYQGTSTPPPDDTIVTTSEAQAKPPAGHPAVPVQNQARPQTAPANPAANDTDPDSGPVAVQRTTPAPEPQTLTTRAKADPDGDIVHPRPPRPGEIPEGTTIRVRLLEGLSSASSEKGETFRSRVATDVLQGETVLIPAGAEIDGRVVGVSTGHAGGHGSMHLRPETIIMPDGKRYQLRAEITGTPGSKSKVGSEGAILPGSRMKRDSIEYGGAVGAGVTAGAIMGGPVGALAGGLVGTGVITAHLLVSHPQARLESGTAMLFTLTEPLQMTPPEAVATGESDKY
jgi:hypothetical protein